MLCIALMVAQLAVLKAGGSAVDAAVAVQAMLTLVEPCAIALENAILFQRTEQLTITDDLTKLFNSRYLNLYLSREIKRCKRHGIPLSIIFLFCPFFMYLRISSSGDSTPKKTYTHPLSSNCPDE